MQYEEKEHEDQKLYIVICDRQGGFPWFEGCYKLEEDAIKKADELNKYCAEFAAEIEEVDFFETYFPTRTL